MHLLYELHIHKTFLRAFHHVPNELVVDLEWRMFIL